MATTSTSAARPLLHRNVQQWRPGAGDWQREAHCRDVGTDLFFPRENQPRKEVAEQEQWAKHYCRSCNVRLDCLAHALATPERDGVWGGTTFKERAALARTLSNTPRSERQGPTPGSSARLTTSDSS